MASSRRAAPAVDAQWEGFVRNVLSDLLSSLQQRRRAEAPHTTHSSPVEPPPLPPRVRVKRRSPFSRYHLEGAGLHDRVCVPSVAVVYEARGMAVLRRPGGTHGWYRIDDRGALTQTNEAWWRVAVGENLVRVLKLAWPAEESVAFHTRARHTFAAYARLVRCAWSAADDSTRAARKRSATAEPVTPVTPTVADAATCAICLCAHPTATARCRHSTCGVPTCATCHADSRGFCALCDREAINAKYRCDGCGRAHSLTRYGYACVGCGASSLCDGCYAHYAVCGACTAKLSCEVCE